WWRDPWRRRRPSWRPGCLRRRPCSPRSCRGAARPACCRSRIPSSAPAGRSSRNALAIWSPCCFALLIDDFAGAARDAHLASVIEELVADTGRGAALGIGDRDVRDVDRAFLVDDAAGLAWRLLGVALHHVDALHDEAVLLAQDLQDLAGTALVTAGNDHDPVALPDLELSGHDSEHLGRQRDDFHELSRAQLARHRPENAGADRLVLRRDQHRRVAVETDRAAVGAADFLRGADNHRAVHVALLHAAARDRLFDRDDDDVADHGVFALRAAEHLDALDATSAGIVGHVEIGLHLDHDTALAPPTTTQRLRLEIGRLSSMRTTSPILCALASSCAAYFFERVTNFL